MSINTQLRKEKHLTFKEFDNLKLRLLAWSQKYDQLSWLDSNEHHDEYGRFEAALAVGAHSILQPVKMGNFEALKQYQAQTSDWLFGYLGYDLKNEIEKLHSSNIDGLRLSNIHFFQPKKLFLIQDNKLVLLYLPDYESEMEEDILAIENIDIPDFNSKQQCKNVKIQLRLFKDEYLARVGRMLDHIKRGDIYEANFCQEFFAQNASIDPFCTYVNLNRISKAPFAAYLKNKDSYLLCASPERYLQRRENKVISQPIKGTTRRSKNPRIDQRLRQSLYHDPKERSENIMIVDMVRNDLAHTAIKGSVQVEELCEVYSFEQVHQMISTVTSKVEDHINSIDIIATTFPMGSMTGAPKISAMKIIEDLEESKRGLYSGAVGYFEPKGSFDFNVVIRSIIYNASREYISYSVGSAITAKSQPKKEYEECLIKAKAMREVLEQ